MSSSGELEVVRFRTSTKAVRKACAALLLLVPLFVAQSAILNEFVSSAGAEAVTSCGPAGSVAISGTWSGDSPQSGQWSGNWSAGWTQDSSGTILSGSFGLSFSVTEPPGFLTDLDGQTCQTFFEAVSSALSGGGISVTVSPGSFTVVPSESSAWSIQSSGSWTEQDTGDQGSASGSFSGSGTLTVNPASAPLAGVGLGSGTQTAVQPEPCNNSGLNPVNCASGDFWHTFTDFDIPGRGIPLDLSRTFNSLAANSEGIFGYGWSSSYDSHLTVNFGRIGHGDRRGRIPGDSCPDG